MLHQQTEVAVITRTLKDVQSSSQITITKYQNSIFFTGRMPFLSPNQQCHSTESRDPIHQQCHVFSQRSTTYHSEELYLWMRVWSMSVSRKCTLRSNSWYLQ